MLDLWAFIYSVGYNSEFYFVAQIVPTLAIGCSLKLASKPFNKPLSSLKPFLILVPQDVPGSSCIFSAAVGNQPLLQGVLKNIGMMIQT